MIVLHDVPVLVRYVPAAGPVAVCTLRLVCVSVSPPANSSAWIAVSSIHSLASPDVLNARVSFPLVDTAVVCEILIHRKIFHSSVCDILVSA